jgi:hypothetical protein
MPPIIPRKQGREEPRLADCPLSRCPRKIAFHAVSRLTLSFYATWITGREKQAVVCNERIKSQEVLVNDRGHVIDNAVDFGICQVPQGASFGVVRSLGPESDVKVYWEVGRADDFSGVA